MPWTEEEMAAEAEADSLKEAARNRPPAPKEELIAQLNSAVTILLAPPSGQAVAEANAWLMGLTDRADCWPTCLAAWYRATDDGTVTVRSVIDGTVPWRCSFTPCNRTQSTF